MTTHIFSAAPTNASDAAFRAWASGLSAAIQAVGFVKVPYGGSADWATALTPTAAFTFTAREVFRFNDALQVSAPLFFAIEYGGGSHATALTLRFSIGKGVDEAGALTGTMLNQIVVGSVSGTAALSNTTVPQSHAVSSCRSGACLNVVTSISYAGRSAAAFVLERSRDNKGDPTGDGFIFTPMQSSMNPASMSSSPNPFYAVSYGSGAHTLGSVPALVPYRIAGTVLGASSSLAAGVIAPVLPWIAFAPGLAPWQPLAGVSYAPGDAIGGSLINVRALGADRTYRVIPFDDGHHGWGAAPRPYEYPDFTSSSTVNVFRSAGLMILWED